MAEKRERRLSVMGAMLILSPFGLAIWGVLFWGACLLFSSSANAQTGFGMHDQRTLSALISAGQAEEEGRVCRWLHRDSYSSLRLRDRARAHCRANGHEPCSSGCRNLLIEGGWYESGRQLDRAPHEAGRASRSGLEKAKEWWREFLEGWNERGRE